MSGQLLLSVALLAALCSPAVSQTAAAAKPATDAASPASKLEAYSGAVNTIADNINKATEKSEALVSKHMSAVDKDPGSLITKEAMQKMMQGSSFLPQAAGTRSILLEPQQGFNGISNFQPSGWKIVETMSGPTNNKQEPVAEKQPVYTYPSGLGPVLLNGCTAEEYSETSPCYKSKMYNLQSTICPNLMEAANFIGVGFDGRGYYRSESRKASLIQRACAKRSMFMGRDVPDTMNVFGIFDTVAETKSFQSADEYMSYIRNKAGLSDQKNLFTSEANKYGKSSGFGFSLGAIGSIVGGAIGAFAGGPVGASMGANALGAVGSSINGGKASGSGSESSTDKGQSSSGVQQTESTASKMTASQNFFAMMYVNIILYEITLDDVSPIDINLAALKDYMSLPVSYYSIGAQVKYQNYLLRWGTHFIRSAKFGGQLKVTKTCKTDKVQSEQQFARIAETEFQSMLSTLQSSYAQKSSSWGFLGFGGESKSANQNSAAKSESSYTGTSSAQNQQSQSASQSEFTQTTVEAQGGTPEIAEALFDFYTPAFKQLFHDWIVSIKDYPKPFEFQMRPINELFNLNMDSLFPAGNLDYGCVKGEGGKVTILVDPDTSKRYYMDTRTSVSNGTTVEIKVRVDCKYSSISDFKQDMERRIISLEKAVAVYMAEGPFPTSSVDLPAGQPGCEEAAAAQMSVFSTSETPLKFDELLKMPFIIAFNLPESIPDLVTMQAKYMMVYRNDRWFAVDPEEQLLNIYDGCQYADAKPNDKKVCFRNIILTYEENTGYFRIENSDFAASKLRIPSLPYWLAGTTIAQSGRLEANTLPNKKRAAIPCNVRWLNSHRLDPSKDDNCIHFTAATEGDVFVVFASIPRDHTTWYYLQISPGGVSFYQAMTMQKVDQRKGMGVLGDKNLYQSFFVCVLQKSGSVTMQYGKADPDSEIGTVHAAYTFPPDSQFSRLTFYSFGTGSKPVSLMDVRQTIKMPEVACVGDDYVKKDGRCELLCHAECNGCTQAKSNKSCQQCRSARVVTGSGADKVTECVAQCPAGKYLTATSEALCSPCASGTYKDVEGNQTCSQCPKGTSSTDGAVSCGGCPAGSFSNSVASQKCEKCAAGTFSLSGSTSCTNCSAGQFSEAGQAECNPCAVGKFASSTGTAACQPCYQGFYGDKRGMTACVKCAGPTVQVNGVNIPAGPVDLIFVHQFFPPAGSASCSACTEFQYKPAGSGTCTACPSNALVKSDGASCYRLLAFSSCSSSSVIDNNPDYNCNRAIDGSRRMEKFFSASPRQAGTRTWTGNLSTPTIVRKVVVWRTTDNWGGESGYVGIRVYTASGSGEKLCGEVTIEHVAYAPIACSGDVAATSVILKLDYIEGRFMCFTEVEAYAD